MCAITFAALFFGSQLAMADSVVWSKTTGVNLTSQSGFTYPFYLYNPNASVTYNTEVQQVDGSGKMLATIACGGSVPKGARVKFYFKPHVSADVFWFGTGSSLDSPYGDWVADAGSPPNQCSDKNYFMSMVSSHGGGYAGSSGQVEYFGSLAVAPPKQQVTIRGVGVFACDAPLSDGSVICTASGQGAATANFNFDPTIGHFYMAGATTWYGRGACYTAPAMQTVVPGQAPAATGDGIVKAIQDNGHAGGLAAGETYTLQVPSQNISCPINVNSGDGHAPGSPNVAGAGSGTAVGGAGQCLIGMPYAITLSATDPDGDQIKYGIDWDGNGTVDQTVPSSGYVPSGTPQTASRTFAAAGAKTVRVLVTDSRGLSWAWTTFTFTCKNQSDLAGSAAGSDNGGGGDGGNGGNVATSLSIRAIPSLVRAGETTHVFWSTTNILSCAVTSAIDKAANGLGAWTGAFSAPEGTETSAIKIQTTYTLSCRDATGASLTKSATVDILPSFNEL